MVKLLLDSAIVICAIECLLSFLANIFLKFDIEIDVFIKHINNGNFSHFSIDSPVHCCLQKAIIVSHHCIYSLHGTINLTRVL